MGPEELPSLIRLPKWRVRRIFLRRFVFDLYDSATLWFKRARFGRANEKKVGTADLLLDHLSQFLA